MGCKTVSYEREGFESTWLKVKRDPKDNKAYFASVKDGKVTMLGNQVEGVLDSIWMRHKPKDGIYAEHTAVTINIVDQETEEVFRVSVKLSTWGGRGLADAMRYVRKGDLVALYVEAGRSEKTSYFRVGVATDPLAEEPEWEWKRGVHRIKSTDGQEVIDKVIDELESMLKSHDAYEAFEESNEDSTKP